MRFALISDEHFGPEVRHGGKLRKLTAHAERLTRAFVTGMNDEVRPDLVVNLGDAIEDAGREADLAAYERFVSILSELRAPVLHVAGNHDQVNLSDDDLRKFWKHTGPLHYSRDLGGVHWVVLRTVQHERTKVELPLEQFAWLEQDLAAASSPAIVLMHHPASELRLEDSPWFSHQPQICRVAERRRLRGILEASGKVCAVFNGHVHWNHLDFIAGIPYVTIQSLVENTDVDGPARPAAAWAVCDLDEHRLRVEVQGTEPARYQIELERAGVSRRSSS